MQGKTRRWFNRWLRKFFCWTTNSTSDANFQDQSHKHSIWTIFERQPHPSNTHIYSARKLLHKNRQIKIQARFYTQKPNVWATLPMNLEIETLSSIGHGSIGMRAQYWSYHPYRDDISYLAWISFSKCDFLPCDATNVMQYQCKD